MPPQGGKKKPSKTHIRKGETEKNYIDNLAEQAAGIRQVNPTNDPRWTPEEDTTMTKNIGDHLQQDFSLPGTKKQQQPQQQARPRQAPPPRQRQRPPPGPRAQPTPQQRPKQQPPPQKPKASAPPKSQEFVTKAKIISEKYKRGELSTDQYKSMRKKMTALIGQEIKALEKKISVLENKFLNNQITMKKYNALFDSWNKEIKRLREIREKITVK